MNKTYILIILSVIAVITAVAVFRAENKPANTQDNDAQSSSRQCIQQFALEICVSPDKTELTESESFNLLVSIRNVSAQEFKTTFSTTCTDPLLFINNEPMTVDQVCGQALTDVVIQTDEVKTYNIGPVSASGLESGENILKVAWQEYSGPEVKVYLN